MKNGSISLLYSHASSAQPYTELFWDLSSVWCTRTDMGSPRVRPLSQHTRCLIALPGLPSSGVVAKFLYMFVLTRHLLSSEKDVCQKDMKWNTIFLLQMQHFIEYPTLIFFPWVFQCCIWRVVWFCLFDQQCSVSSPPEMHYKCSITEAETAKRYSKISISLIVENKSQISKCLPEITIGKQGWQVCGLA